MTLSINGKTYEAGELIAYVKNLEKENAELKAFRQDCVKLTEDNVVMARQRAETSRQLTKAKSLLRELYSIIKVECSPFAREDHKNILSEAEQFIKDSEVKK